MATRPSTEEDPDEAFVIAAAAGLGAPGFARVGIGDDAAVLPDGALVTTDTMVEGVHWDDRLTAQDVGWKLVAVNASDIGAMGGRPTWATLALSLPGPVDRAWTRGFLQGLGEGMRHFGIALVGGDTTGSPGPKVATLTLGGLAARPVLRSTARVGDNRWVTGELGLSAEAFLDKRPSPAARRWFARPVPPVAFGAALGEAGLSTAMMDLSDGLARDLARMCRASGVGALVDPVRLPGSRRLEWAVAFGEDYQLCFAASPEASGAICSLAEAHGVMATHIGGFTARRTVALAGLDGWPGAQFDHFTRSDS